ncbi:MAG: hypothetical protein LBC20_02190 [Planctomycetaceae bacterium]|jgi:hypothetical protein|nr:hypothetical protein [Planctomycetaceae bacterium]
MRTNFFRLLVAAIIFVAVFFLNVVTAAAQISKLNPITNPTLEELQKNFKNPPRDFSTGPLWTWNDRLTDEQVRGTLRDLAQQHVRQVWVHPRPGLMTPYLSDEWFARWKTALDEAQKLDMNVWIYDENSYPSGFAGGLVPEALPDSRGMGLKFEEVTKLDQLDKNIRYVFCPQDNNQDNNKDNNQDNNISYKNITGETKNSGKLEPLPNGKKYLLGKVQYTPQGGWFGGKWYVDLLKKGVTEKFLDITLDAYKNVPEIQKEFGNRVPGIFTDEPHPAGSYVGTWVTWNGEIPDLFEKRFGYSLIDNLPSLSKTVGDWKKVRHNYHQLILELFAERWAKPYFERCEKYGLEFTGHYWEHGWPNTSHGPDNMAMYIWSQRPAIDLLMNTYNDKSPNAQFGNVRSVKELASVANQMGHSRTLSENYGAGGWDIRFEDLKRLGDWSYALGVNTNNEHLSYVTIKGARKRDHPQSFSYHASWFEGYHILADYFTRLSYMLSQGRQVNRIVVIEPTTTAWMYQGDPKLNEIGQSFTDFVNALEHAHVEYDLASEDIIKRFGKIKGKEFIINQAKYDMVIIPPNTENLNSETAELLSLYHNNGGKLILVETEPNLCDGASPKDANVFKVSHKKVTNRDRRRGVKEGTTHFKFTIHSVKDAVEIAKERTNKDGLTITTYPLTTEATYREKDAKHIFHHRRRFADGEVLFFCNSSQTDEAQVSIKPNENYPFFKFWYFCSLETGEMVRAEEWDNSSYNFSIPLYPSGSLLLIFSNKAIGEQNMWRRNIDWDMIRSISETKIRRLEDNVLTLDYVDVKVGNEERQDIYTWAANRFVFQKHGMESGNPWDSQVQFKDELITKKFPENSGFEATYHFTLQESVPKNLAVVIERPDLYRIYCNDKEVQAIPNAWWLDKAFGKIDLSQVAKVGENNVKIVAQPMTIEHELEPAYLLGDFSLQNSEKGFTVVPPQDLSMNFPDSNKTLNHNEEPDHVAWLSAGVDFRSDKPELVDRSPTLEFDFGREQEIAAIRIWNYNERNLKQRGVKTVEITGLGKIDLPIGDGSAYELPFNSSQKFKTITFKILSNHNGATYPIRENEQPKDNGFVGLAEVQFWTKENNVLTLIKNVLVRTSSELVTDSHDRKASYLADGSGFNAFKPTWNQQGMPFYAGKVEYSQTFNVEKIDSAKNYFVGFPLTPKGLNWSVHGSTVQIMVNGQSAGFFISANQSIEVTKLLREGNNEISMIVYGTPKNLLGPHHAGAMRGQAWPNAFHRAPEHQPSGASYDTIGYGLFEPFVLISY